MRDRAGRAAVAAPQGQAVGRHERRRHLIEVGAEQMGPEGRATQAAPAAGTRATRAGRARTGQAEATRASRAARGRATSADRTATIQGRRAARSRHATPAGWATWVGRVTRVAGQARVWWTEGTERVAARAREQWQEQVAGARRSTTARRATTGGQVASVRPAAGGSGPGPTVGAEHGTWARARNGGESGSRVRSGNDADHTPRIRSAAGATPTPRSRAAAAPRHLAGTAKGRWGEDLVTGWCSVLLVLGLYLDGWTHSNPTQDVGPVLTPWHGLLYAAFVATAAWILTRDQRRGAWSLDAVPAGYRLALVGLGLAMVAVAGDAGWHALYGAEQGLARLVSPFHLVLLAGACLLVSAALRAAWAGPSSARVPGLRVFWPVVLSTTLVVAMAAFFFQAVSPAAGSPVAEAAPVDELVGLLVQNLFFVAPVLLLLLRWQTPLGTFTVMAGSVAWLLATQTGLGLVGLVGAAVLGGAAADVAVSLLRPSPQRRWAARAVAVVAPAVYWTSHFALLTVGYGVGWELEMWLGSVVWASLSGLALAVLMWPPAVPLTAWNRGRAAAARSPATPTPTAMPSSMPARMVGR